MKNLNRIQGVVVPMVTPFTTEGTIDPEAAARITHHIIAAGASVFVLGTTGEGPSITPAARAQLLQAVKHHTDEIPLFAGISDNCIEVSIALARQYADLGVDVVVTLAPSYYPLGAKDMIRYFETMADSIPIPLMLYNMPLTTNMSLSLETIDQLSHHPNIVGIKDSENDTQRLEEALTRWRTRNDFKHLIGCSTLSLKALSLGSDGIVPSAGNLAPSIYCRLYEAVQKGDLEAAEHMQHCGDRITEIYNKDRLLSQSLPILKAMMSVYGFCSPQVLPPLQTLNAEQIKQISRQKSLMDTIICQP